MPKTVKVGTHVYTVLRKPKSQMPDGEIGGCDFDSLQIVVQKGLRRSKAKEILVHETLHTCTYPLLKDEKKRTDEQFITGVAPVLLQVLQDNPELVAYLTQ
jgi:hypothetical protein